MMTEVEIRGALGVASDDRQKEAILQLIEEHIGLVLTQLQQPNLAIEHGALAHLQGGFTWLTDFQSKLITEYNNAAESLSGEEDLKQEKGGY